MRLRKKLVRGAIYHGLRILIFIAYLIPMNTSVKIGGFLGRLVYYILHKERRKTINNLKRAFPEKDNAELKKIAKGCFASLGNGLFELINLPKINKNNLDKIVKVEGEAYVKEALSRRRGFIFITGHVGNWELMGAVFGIKGYKVNVIAAPLYDNRINELLIRQRSIHNIRVILRGSQDIKRKIIKALHNNESLSMLIDQDTKVPGVFVDFFGRQAYTPLGAASIALRTGSPVLMGFITRQSDNTHKITIGPALKLINTGDRESDIRENTLLFTKIIEEQIRKTPEQWVWMHNRWKKQPEKHN
ncbi:MAG: lysophospholipid acyltransferase family protein [Nitrospirae bacterium]|nr:lysophospholipid acyltransferase family protein [Nitrospirota bacterium]